MSGYPGGESAGIVADDPFAAFIPPAAAAGDRAAFSSGSEDHLVRQPDLLPAWQPAPAVVPTDSGPVREENRRYGSEKGFFSSMQIIGQVWNSYLILCHEETLYLLDQHAAHERILYEQLQQRMNSRNASQKLLLPITMDLSPDELAAVQEYGDILAQLGFSLAPFGTNAIILTGMPILVKDYDPREFFHEVVADLLHSRSQAGKNLPLLNELAAGMACRLAVKASDALSREEIELLLMQLDQVGVAQTCPHGRPLYFTMSRHEMEKKFQRR